LSLIYHLLVGLDDLVQFQICTCSVLVDRENKNKQTNRIKQTLILVFTNKHLVSDIQFKVDSVINLNFMFPFVKNICINLRKDIFVTLVCLIILVNNIS